MRRLLLLFLAVVVCSWAFIFAGNLILGQKKTDVTSLKVHGNPHDPRNLPLGDGRNSAEPKQGYLMPCQMSFFGGPGAFRDGPWIHSDGTWDATSKIEVAGDVAWDNYRYEIKIENGVRRLIGNGLPDHHTGKFPVQQSDPAFNYDRNPNTIRQSEISFSLPLMPTLADRPSCVPMGVIGVMRSGVVLFNALDAQGRDAVAHEIQDKCNGHPERDGHYHYHNLSKCIEETNGKGHSELVGYALDGFGIFGVFGENGKELTNADLDKCHGHTHDIMWDGKRISLYHYHATREFPYTVGCFVGKAVSARRGPPSSGPLPFF